MKVWPYAQDEMGNFYYWDISCVLLVIYPLILSTLWAFYILKHSLFIIQYYHFIPHIFLLIILDFLFFQSPTKFKVLRYINNRPLPSFATEK